MTKRNDVCVKVYFSKGEFLEIIKRAEKAGKRPRGLIPYTQKKHGFEHEKVANTDYLSLYLKMCEEYYIEHESSRLQEVAKLLDEEKKLQERKKKLGIQS